MPARYRSNQNSCASFIPIDGAAFNKVEKNRKEKVAVWRKTMSNRSANNVTGCIRVLSDSEYKMLAAKSDKTSKFVSLLGTFELDMSRPEPTVEEEMAEMLVCKRMQAFLDRESVDNIKGLVTGVWPLTRRYDLRRLTGNELHRNGGVYSPRVLTRHESVPLLIAGKLLEANPIEILDPRPVSASRKKELKKYWASTARRADEPVLTYFCWPPEAPPAQKQMTLKLA